MLAEDIVDGLGVAARVRKASASWRATCAGSFARRWSKSARNASETSLLRPQRTYRVMARRAPADSWRLTARRELWMSSACCSLVAAFTARRAARGAVCGRAPTLVGRARARRRRRCTRSAQCRRGTPQSRAPRTSRRCGRSAARGRGAARVGELVNLLRGGPRRFAARPSSPASERRRRRARPRRRRCGGRRRRGRARRAARAVDAAADHLVGVVELARVAPEAGAAPDRVLGRFGPRGFASSSPAPRRASARATAPSPAQSSARGARVTTRGEGAREPHARRRALAAYTRSPRSR